MNCQQINEIDIENYLASMGIHPARVSGHSLWYLSPIRDEKTPSFKINTKINQWYDFGEAKGGKLVDLLLEMHQTTIPNLLKTFNFSGQRSFSFGRQKNDPKPEEGVRIKLIKPLQNQALLEYLDERKIPISIAEKYCNEMYYRVGEKNFFGISFKNDSDGFEIRNRYFKGSLKNKDITTITEQSNELYLFEGFMDFLSAKAYFQDSSFTAIVLNSASNIEKGISIALELKEQHADQFDITCYFDHNPTGREITQKAASRLSSIDGSKIYEGFADFNEFFQEVKKGEVKKMGRKMRL